MIRQAATCWLRCEAWRLVRPGVRRAQMAAPAAGTAPPAVRGARVLPRGRAAARARGPAGPARAVPVLAVAEDGPGPGPAPGAAARRIAAGARRPVRGARRRAACARPATRS